MFSRSLRVCTLCNNVLYWFIVFLYFHWAHKLACNVTITICCCYCCCNGKFSASKVLLLKVINKFSLLSVVCLFICCSLLLLRYELCFFGGYTPLLMHFSHTRMACYIVETQGVRNDLSVCREKREFQFSRRNASSCEDITAW